MYEKDVYKTVLLLSDRNCLPLAGAVPQFVCVETVCPLLVLFHSVCVMAHNNLYLFHIGEEEDKEVI